MKPLFVLLVAFGLALVITYAITDQINYVVSGRIALSIMMLFTAIGHFIFPKGMSLMMPDFIPYKTELIYATGVIEIFSAIGLQLPAVQLLTGWMLILFFIVILPANINAAVKHLNYETGTFDGKGVSYLWFRIPMQLLLIAWTYFFAVAF